MKMEEEVFLPHIEKARREAMKVSSPRARLRVFLKATKQKEAIALHSLSEMKEEEINGWLHFFLLNKF
jgi:hypothetical protein